MQNWEKALNEFLKKYKADPLVEGALLCGSYASGNQNEFSDIDVHVLLSDTQSWRERGVVSINGFLIEYFMNPSKQIRREFREDYANGENVSANMFAFGKILFDKNGCVKKLQEEALKSLKKNPKKWKKDDLLLSLYGVWNLMDEINGLAADKRPFSMIYYDQAKALLRLYFRLKGIPMIPMTKAEKILSNPEFAARYHVQKLPNKQFTKLFLAVLHEVDIKNMQKLYDFVIKEAGGFDISAFKLRSDL